MATINVRKITHLNFIPIKMISRYDGYIVVRPGALR